MASKKILLFNYCLNLFLWLFLVTGSITSYGQEYPTNVTDSIVREGKKLYRSEKASWVGTDIFLNKFKNLRNNIGGYFSYSIGDSATCLFFSKGQDPEVLARIEFDTTYELTKAVIDTANKKFTTFEKEMYTVRKLAVKIINADTLFKAYKNTNFNIVPLIEGENKKVYVMTGSSVTHVMVLGNDYLLAFDSQIVLIEKRQLHRNIIPVKYGVDSTQIEFGAVHTHLQETGAFITPTDICTLMLYERIAKWHQHIVLSETYVSIWDCDKDRLVVMTRRAWDKIYNDQKKGH